MRIIKKILCFSISMCMLFSTSLAFPDFFIKTKAYDNVDEYPDFDFDTYIADLWTNSAKDAVSFRMLDCYVNDLDSPSTILYEPLRDDINFQASVGLWKIATFSVSDIADDSIDEVGYYEAIILKILKCETTNILIDKTFKDGAGIAKRGYAYYKKILKTEYFLDFDFDNIDYKSLDNVKKGDFNKAFEQSFKKDFPVTNQMSKVMTCFTTLLDAGKTIEEAYNTVCAYQMCYELTESMKQVVEDLYSNCDSSNITLKAALLEIKKACENFDAWSFIDASGKEVIEFSVALALKSVDGLVDSVIASLPVGRAILIGQFAGKTISNWLCSTDEIIESYYKMEALYNVEMLLRSTVKSEMSNFCNDKSKDNANILFSAVELFFNTYALSCDYATNFANIMHNAPVASKRLREDTESILQSVKHIKEIVNNEYEREVNTNWLPDLEYEYPGIYDALIEQNTYTSYLESYIPVKNIKFLNDEIEIGLDDMGFILNALVYPENATNREVVYTSSDSSIAEVSGCCLYGNKVGTATITARNIDSGLVASMKVTIVEGHGKDGTVLEPTIIREPAIGDFFEFEGVKYTITSSTEAAVSGRTSNASNYINLPGKVTYKEKEYKVSAISNYAFYNDSTLSYVIMPDTIESIGSYAFYSCYNLKGVSLSSKITNILRDSFYYSGIETLIIPEGVKSIGIEAFSISSSLKTIYLPSTLESIGDGAFFQCKNLQNVYYAGSEDDLKKVTLGTLNSPLNSASYSYHATFPSKFVLSSGNCGEAATYSLTYDGRLSIDGTGELGGWTSSISYNGSQYVVKYNLPWSNFGDMITNIHIGNGITSIPSSIFTVGTFESIDVDENNINYKSIDGVLFDKSGKTLLRYPNGKKNHVYFVPDGVNEIGSMAIVSNSNLSNLIFPDGVTKISSSSIQNCENIKYITIPTTLTDIESGSFSKISDYRLILSEGFTELTKEYMSNFSKMSSVIIPDSVTQIADEAFYNFSALTQVRMGNGVKNLGEGVFVNCNNLKSVTLSNSVSDISYATFYGCTQLNNVYIPNSVKSIGKAAFYNCTSLSNVNLDQNLVSIGSSAFYGCTSLMNIYFPDSLNTIDNWAFQYCAFKSITIPKNVTSIGNYVFSYCANLTDIEVDQKNNYYSSVGGMLYNKTQTELLQVPNGKEMISYRVPSNITKIGKGAFNHCNRLETIIIPFTDIVIDTYAFNECDSLTDVYYAGSRAEWYALDIAENNSSIRSADIHYNYSAMAGDVNLDGNFSVADVVLLQKWLLAQPNINLGDWKAGDLYEDNKLDVFDLCLMKKKLING